MTTKGNAVVDDRIASMDALKKADVLNDPSFIQKFLDLHEDFKGVVSVSFRQDSTFQKSLKEAFESFVNRDLGASNKVTMAALMASFCNRILKKGRGGYGGGYGGGSPKQPVVLFITGGSGPRAL